MKNSKFRFAPSPTGLLHAGNARVAIINWVMAATNNGSMILRIDDTDQERSFTRYIDAIRRDLSWLNLDWSHEVQQIDQTALYDEAIKILLSKGRLYPCYETQEELEYKRRRQLKAGRPPIYDRSALSLSNQERANLEADGKKPYFRFKLNDSLIEWNDLFRGPLNFESKLLSDPILIRGDGRYLYHLPSCVDDLELKITHVIRGEDHVSNTAVHLQIFQALEGNVPNFGHLPLMTDITGVGLSKRFGSITLESLREEGCEPLALANYLISLGSDLNKNSIGSMKELVETFDVMRIGRTKPKFDLNQLWAENTRVLHSLPFEVVADRFDKMGLENTTIEFWNSIKQNIKTFGESTIWHAVCFGNIIPLIDDIDFINEALKSLPMEPWDNHTWSSWTKLLEKSTSRKGKDLFLPLRKAITGKGHGPELNKLLPLIGRKKVIFRLKVH